MPFNSSCLSRSIYHTSIQQRLENLRSVAQTLLQIGQMEETELASCLNEYLAVTNPTVARIAMSMVESKYPQIFERLKVI